MSPGSARNHDAIDLYKQHCRQRHWAEIRGELKELPGEVRNPCKKLRGSASGLGTWSLRCISTCGKVMSSSGSQMHPVHFQLFGSHEAEAPHKQYAPEWTIAKIFMAEHWEVGSVVRARLDFQYLLMNWKQCPNPSWL